MLGHLAVERSMYKHVAKRTRQTHDASHGVYRHLYNGRFLSPWRQSSLAGNSDGVGLRQPQAPMPLIIGTKIEHHI